MKRMKYLLLVAACAGALAACGGTTATQSNGSQSNGSQSNGSQSSDASDCIVNGLGNELCGDAARALCQLEDDNGTLDDDSADACYGVGWDPGPQQ